MNESLLIRERNTVLNNGRLIERQRVNKEKKDIKSKIKHVTIMRRGGWVIWKEKDRYTSNFKHTQPNILHVSKNTYVQRPIHRPKHKHKCIDTSQYTTLSTTYTHTKVPNSSNIYTRNIPSTTHTHTHTHTQHISHITQHASHTLPYTHPGHPYPPGAWLLRHTTSSCPCG